MLPRTASVTNRAAAVRALGDNMGGQMTRMAHRIVGALGVAVFLATGVYMAGNFPQLHQGNDAIRYQFRANHGYILFGSLANLLLGLHLGPTLRRWRAPVQQLGSLLLLLAPPVLILAFVVEPPRASSDRLLTLIGWVLALGGSALHALARLTPGAGRSA
jgi:hypothetical protein